MKRPDILLAIALSGLAAFVGGELLATHEASDAEPLVARSTTPALTSDVANGISSTTPNVTSGTSLAPWATPLRLADGDAERAVILDGFAGRASGTFIGEILAGNRLALSRWPSRQLRPLRVWIQPTPNIDDESVDGVAIVREAFSDWTGTGIPLTFSFVFDSASADVQVTWTDHFSSAVSGRTLASRDAQGWIVAATIMLAVHQLSGARLDSGATRAIALHEVGHLIGLDHTADTTSIMTPLVRVQHLSAADRATAQLLYLLPAGRFGVLPKDVAIAR